MCHNDACSRCWANLPTCSYEYRSWRTTMTHLPGNRSDAPHRKSSSLVDSKASTHSFFVALSQKTHNLPTNRKRCPAVWTKFGFPPDRAGKPENKEEAVCWMHVCKKTVSSTGQTTFSIIYACITQRRLVRVTVKNSKGSRERQD